jgi:tRNA (cmo5U34)-methyltransferase
MALTPPPAAEAFSAHAEHYTALRRRLVPGYDAFYSAVTDVLDGLLAPERRAELQVLDLGAGTGLLSAQIQAVFPHVRLTLLDASEPMLREARQRLGAGVQGVHVGDMADGLPDGRFDAIVSALAIHHLEHPAQRELFDRCRAALAPGGIFVNAEQLAGPSAGLTEAYEQRWARECRALGATEAELAETRERMRHDRCIDLGTQLGWLRDAGFAPVDCIYRRWRLAVYFGVRP